MHIIKEILLAFIPLFVAIDVLGVVPLYLSLTEPLNNKQRLRLTTDACLTALAISLVFLIGGNLIFKFLGITEYDFRIGGGIVLLVLAVSDLLFTPEEQRNPHTSVGVVPLGVPLIIGPAALTTILILVDAYGYIITIIALFLNLGGVWLIFRNSDVVIRVIGKAGSKAIAKVAALLMAAIAIMMIRVGVVTMISMGGK